MEIELYKQYQSLRKVSTKTGIPVSTLWYRLQKAQVLNKKTKVTHIHENNALLKGLYIGMWAGDGSRYYNNGFITKIHVNKNDVALISLIKNVVKRLFEKEIALYLDGKNDNRAALKIHSEFIYKFPEKYLAFSKQKATTVRLKSGFSSQFLEGFLLGITLTDGYLKDRFVFATVSKKLSKQVFRILKRKGFLPKVYIHNREKFGWNDLHSVRLIKEQSRQIKIKFDRILNRLGSKFTINTLKRY